MHPVWFVVTCSVLRNCDCTHVAPLPNQRMFIRFYVSNKLGLLATRTLYRVRYMFNTMMWSFFRRFNIYRRYAVNTSVLHLSDKSHFGSAPAVSRRMPRSTWIAAQVSLVTLIADQTLSRLILPFSSGVTIIDSPYLVRTTELVTK